MMNVAGGDCAGGKAGGCGDGPAVGRLPYPLQGGVGVLVQSAC